jgi:hypothetical protein
LIKPERNKKSGTHYYSSLLALEKQENSRREEAANSISKRAERTKPSHPPSLPRRKGEVRKPRQIATEMLLLLHLQKIQKRSQRDRGYHFISKKKFLLSSQKVCVSRFEACCCCWVLLVLTNETLLPPLMLPTSTVKTKLWRAGCIFFHSGTPAQSSRQLFVALLHC